MSDLRRQFSIDDHLGRNAKALESLHQLDVFEELTRYTCKHSLFGQALDLCRYQDTRYNNIMRLFADDLNARSVFNEAGIGESTVKIDASQADKSSVRFSI